MGPYLESTSVLQFGPAVLGVLDTSKEQLLNLGCAGDIHVLGFWHPRRRPPLEVLASFNLICLSLHLGCSQVLPARKDTTRSTLEQAAG